MRVNKAFRRTHSRREADRLVSARRVRVNGEEAGPGDRLVPGDVVTLDGRAVEWEELEPSVPGRSGGSEHSRVGLMGGRGSERAAGEAASGGSLEAAMASMAPYVYLMYWKPRGVICTTDRSVRGNVIDALLQDSALRDFAGGQRLFTVGRLDKPSTGAVLVTSDGRVPNAVLGARRGHPKEYEVRPHQAVEAEDLERLRAGVVITTEAQRDGQRKALTARTLPCEVERAGPRRESLRITLTEGRNRQIRRMLGALGYETLELHRRSFAGLGLGAGCAGPGAWAPLDEAQRCRVAGWLHEAAAAPG